MMVMVGCLTCLESPVMLVRDEHGGGQVAVDGAPGTAKEALRRRLQPR